MKRKHIIRNSDGAAAIEFAILAPVLFTLMLGIVELGLLMFASSVIENAATSASRIGLTGNDGSTANGGAGNFGDTAARRAIVENEIYKYAFGLIDPAKLHFDPVVHHSMTNVNGGGPKGLGSGNDAVTYDLSYDWEFFTPLIGDLIGKKGVYTITSSIIVKNEDF